MILKNIRKDTVWKQAEKQANEHKTHYSRIGGFDVQAYESYKRGFIEAIEWLKQRSKKNV